MFISSDTELSIDSTSAVALVPPDKGRHTRAQRTVIIAATSERIAAIEGERETARRRPNQACCGVAL